MLKNNLIFTFWQRLSNAISLQAIAIFFRQFATLMNAGIPLVRACDMLEKSQKPYFNRLINTIKKEMLAGQTLSFCLRQYPQYFTSFICQLVHIGEQTGKLEFILLTIAEHQEKELRFKKQIRQALFYPALILLTALMITTIMFLFVVPKFALLFADIQQQLPLLTIVIFYLAQKMQDVGGIFFGIIMLILLLGFYTNKKFLWSQRLSYFFTTMPLLNLHFNKIILVRFARNLALTFTSGITITEALNLSAEASGNGNFTTIIKEVSARVRSGLPLYYALALFPIFPVLMIQMIKIGEESGQLEQMLNKTADFFETDIEQFIKYFTQLLEPLIMLVLGVLIGGLILGMYLPIFKLGNAF